MSPRGWREAWVPAPRSPRCWSRTPALGAGSGHPLLACGGQGGPGTSGCARRSRPARSSWSAGCVRGNKTRVSASNSRKETGGAAGRSSEAPLAPAVSQGRDHAVTPSHAGGTPWATARQRGQTAGSAAGASAAGQDRSRATAPLCTWLAVGTAISHASPRSTRTCSSRCCPRPGEAARGGAGSGEQGAGPERRCRADRPGCGLQQDVVCHPPHPRPAGIHRAWSLSLLGPLCRACVCVCMHVGGSLQG